MLAVALTADVTWGRLRRGNVERFQLGYRLRPVSASSYEVERVKNVERGYRDCFKVIFRHSIKRLMKTAENLK